MLKAKLIDHSNAKVIVLSSAEVEVGQIAYFFNVGMFEPAVRFGLFSLLFGEVGQIASRFGPFLNVGMLVCVLISILMNYV